MGQASMSEAAGLGLLNDCPETCPFKQMREDEAGCDQRAKQQEFSFEGHG
jgi:hypothetical protein